MRKLLPLLLPVLITGCTHKEPNFIYMPDMVYQPAFKAQKEGAMRMPVKGTVPRDFEPYPYAKDENAAARELKNPLPMTASVLERGQSLYNSYCITCHGPKGSGDGPVAAKLGAPPSFHTDKVRGWTDGRIYHTITVGQNIMPSYTAQVSPEDRWAIIHYVRVLQRSQKPTAEDMKGSN